MIWLPRPFNPKIPLLRAGLAPLSIVSLALRTGLALAGCGFTAAGTAASTAVVEVVGVGDTRRLPSVLGLFSNEETTEEEVDETEDLLDEADDEETSEEAVEEFGLSSTEPPFEDVNSSITVLNVSCAVADDCCCCSSTRCW